jgi:hypothetical protein
VAFGGSPAGLKMGTNWVSVTNLIGDGTLRTVIVPLAPGPRRFFRVREP